MFPDGLTELTLGRGDFFGERALLNDDVRKATVTALDSGTECLVLDRKPFMELLGSVKELQLAAGIKETRSSDAKLVSGTCYKTAGISFLTEQHISYRPGAGSRIRFVLVTQQIHCDT